MNAVFCLFLVTLLPWMSCATGKKSLREHKGSYLESAKLNFEAGEAAYKKEDYDKAIGYYQFVRSKYPFSKFASLSDLRIADARFAQKKWLDAAAAYGVFIRLHPRHEQVAYASYRVGASYLHAIPEDFFLLPKRSSRDQSFTKEALAAIERFIVQYPHSEYIEDAKAKQHLLFSYLAQHNMDIAAYYNRRGKYKAAVDRYLSVENLYPETKESAECLYLAAELLEKKLNDINGAIELFQKIVQEKPNSKYAAQAQKNLDRLES